MAIYDRSNIDYSGMIRDMINARTAGAKIAADNIRNQGELWGNFAKDIGGVASRTWDAAHLDDTDMPGIANYVAFGDSSLLDRQLAEAAARRQMAVQQNFQAKESDLNRALQERIAKMNANNSEADAAVLKAREASKSQLEADIAQAEYDDAISKVDLDKPETILAAKKAALKLNYANSNLPYFDKEVHTVSTEFKEDAPGVAKTKRVNNAVKYLDTITGVPTDRWSDDEVSNYEDQIDVLRNDAPELVKKYEVEMDKKGPSVEQRNKAKAKRKTEYDNFIAGLPKTKHGDISPSAMAKLLKENERFKKLHKEFGGE